MKVMYLVTLENTKDNDIHENQVLGLMNRGIDYCFLFLSPLFLLDRKGFRFNTNKFEKKQVKEIKIPLLSQHFCLHVLFFPLFFILAMPCFLVERYIIKPDIIHCRNLLSTLLACSSRKLFRLKYKVISDPRSVYVEEGVIQRKWRYNGVNYKIWKYLEKKIYADADACFGLSPYFSDVYLKPFNINSFFIPAVVDDKRVFDPLIRVKMREQFGLTEKDVVLCYLGSIGLWHSVDSLINIIRIVAKSLGVGYKFHLVLLMGNTAAINRICSEVEQDAIIFAGRVPPSKVHDYLLMADFGIVPGTNTDDPCHDLLNKTMLSSKAEEYLVSGLPVLVNPSLIGLAELVTEAHAGMIVSESMSLQYSDFDRQAISETFSKMFNVVTVINKYQRVYRELSC